jgi:hypothetical protein
LCNVYRRRVRASTRLIEAAKALATRNYVRDISRLLALSNKLSVSKLLEVTKQIVLLQRFNVIDNSD